MATRLPSGFRLVPGYLDRAAQARLVDEVHAAMHRAPPYVPRMPRSGRPLSVRMTNCGPLGWVTDAGGYRYHEIAALTGTSYTAVNRWIDRARKHLRQQWGANNTAAGL